MVPNEKDQALEQFLKEFEENNAELRVDPREELEEIKKLLDTPDTPRRMPRARSKKKKSWKKPVLITLSCFVAVILLFVGGVALYMNHLFSQFGRPDDQLQSQPSFGESGFLTMPPEETVAPDNTAPTVDASDVTMPTLPAEVIDSEHVINIMLVGEDAKYGYYRGRTDSMILCTINTKNKTISLTSFLRDLYVTIPGVGNNRLNAAYVYGGFELMRDTILWNFGVEIDHFVKVEMEVFGTVVDTLGGVDINLTQAEVEHLNSERGWNLAPGLQHLDGERALAYSRIRMIDSDFNRTRRQQNVLRSIFDTYKTKPLGELLSITEALLPNLTITLTNAELWDYMFKVVPMLMDLEISSQQIPGPGTFSGVIVDNMAVLVPDMEANREILENIIKP